MKQIVYESPVGRITLVSDGGALIGAWIEGQKYFAATLQEEPENDPEEPVLRQAAAWLDAYFAGKKPAVSDLPLQPRGSAFRQEVWRLLCEIPYGATVTYGELAGKIAAARGMKRFSAQAVGGAVGHNPISIIIPCHRVVGADGSLTGYAGGIARKVSLLKHEGALTDRMYVPEKGTAL